MLAIVGEPSDRAGRRALCKPLPHGQCIAAYLRLQRLQRIKPPLVTNASPKNHFHVLPVDGFGEIEQMHLELIADPAEWRLGLFLATSRYYLKIPFDQGDDLS